MLLPVTLMVAVAAFQGAPCTPTPKSTSPATLTVEVVDENWLPLPGAEVTVTAQDRGRESWRAITGGDGAAGFPVSRPSKYIIEAYVYGFKKRRLKDVTIGVVTGEPTAARVQVRLIMSGPKITVY